MELERTVFAGVNPECEFGLAVRAKLGDRLASERLWAKYKPVLVPLFRQCKNLSPDEMVSEAALVMARELELFMPGRIGSSAQEAWTFSSMLTNRAENAVDMIIQRVLSEINNYGGQSYEEQKGF
jgi:hypothetical protein